jgi:hypothetical protein
MASNPEDEAKHSEDKQLAKSLSDITAAIYAVAAHLEALRVEVSRLRAAYEHAHPLPSRPSTQTERGTTD